jgi:hypothetical protein
VPAAIAVAAAVLLAPGTVALARASTAVRTAALDSPEQFGVNTGVMFNSEQYTRAQIDAQLAALAATGATVVRSDALWEYIEQQPPIGVFHRYNWTLDDQIVSSLAAHGLHWLPIIDYSATWARAAPNQLHSPPSSVGDYANFAAAVASRYGPGGSFWLENPGIKPVPVLTYEIWNEPDNATFWPPTPNPAAYATLYTTARNAIKAKQPGAEVLVGGLTRPPWFLANLLAADPGLRGQIDGVSIHPYASTPGHVLAGVRDARLAMRSVGLAGVPLYVTEIGWTTHGSGFDSASAAERPGFISTTISTLGHTDCGVAAVMLYAWTTPERNAANPEDWFGISPPGAGGSPDTAAFTTAIAAAEAPAPPVLLCSADPPLTLLGAPSARSPARRGERHRPTHRARHRGRRARCARSAAKHRRCRAAKRRR